MLVLLIVDLLNECSTSKDDSHFGVFKQVLQYVALESFVPEMITILLDTYVSACRESNQVDEETGDNIKRYLRLIDARYPSQLDMGLNAALHSLRGASRGETKRARRKRRNSGSKRSAETGNGDASEEDAPGKHQIEDQILNFISLTFQVRRIVLICAVHCWNSGE